jgi:carboxypeptidase C (cathepsin A)
MHILFSQNDPINDPIILWLNGGPGCSSLIAFFNENGPFIFSSEDATNMSENIYSWNKKANVLYIESPAGVGFSYGSKPFLNTNDSALARDNLHAILLFFEKYPDLIGNDFYLAGSGYAGVYIPLLAD